MAAESVVCPERQLEVDRIARLQRAERGALKRRVHDVGAELLRPGFDRRQADPVDGDRVAGGGPGRDRGAYPQAPALRGAID